MVWIQLPLKTLAMQVIPATGGFFRLILMLSYIARATKQPLYTSSHKSRHSAPYKNCAPPVIMRIWIIYLCLFYSRSLDPAPFFCFYGTSRHGNMPVHQPQISSLHSFFKIVTFLHGISFWKGSNAWSMNQHPILKMASACFQMLLPLGLFEMTQLRQDVSCWVIFFLLVPHPRS